MQSTTCVNRRADRLCKAAALQGNASEQYGKARAKAEGLKKDAGDALRDATDNLKQ